MWPQPMVKHSKALPCCVIDGHTHMQTHRPSSWPSECICSFCVRKGTNTGSWLPLPHTQLTQDGYPHLLGLCHRAQSCTSKSSLSLVMSILCLLLWFLKSPLRLTLLVDASFQPPVPGFPGEGWGSHLWSVPINSACPSNSYPSTSEIRIKDTL